MVFDNADNAGDNANIVSFCHRSNFQMYKSLPLMLSFSVNL